MGKYGQFYGQFFNYKQLRKVDLTAANCQGLQGDASLIIPTLTEPVSCRL
jgi:hypothetical protein